jgi:hypothetical protein
MDKAPSWRVSQPSLQLATDVISPQILLILIARRRNAGIGDGGLALRRAGMRMLCVAEAKVAMGFTAHHALPGKQRDPLHAG